MFLVFKNLSPGGVNLMLTLKYKKKITKKKTLQSA